MSSFRFPLAGLERLRKSERDARRLEYAHALTRQSHAKSARQLAEASLAKQRQRRATQARGHMALIRLRQEEQFEITLRHQFTRCQENERIADESVEACRQTLLAAEHAYQSLCKLHQRQQCEHNRASERAAIAELDEFAMQRFVGGMRETLRDSS